MDRWKYHMANVVPQSNNIGDVSMAEIKIFKIKVISI